MKRHSKPQDLTEEKSYPSLQARTARAFSYLDTRFGGWNIKTDSIIGFEILVSAHLKFLDWKGLSMNFPQRPVLMALNYEEMRLSRPSHVYGSHENTVLHSLQSNKFNVVHSCIIDELLEMGSRSIGLLA